MAQRHRELRIEMKLPAVILLSLTVGAVALADDSPRDHIDIDIRHNWRPSDFSPSGVPSARDIGIDFSGDAPRFISRTPAKHATFSKPLQLPVDMEKFPTFILK